jgi:hypothetical protein
MERPQFNQVLPMAVQVGPGPSQRKTVTLNLPGVHPWFAALACRDALWDSGYDVSRMGRVTQVGGSVYSVEVSE